MPTYTLEAVLGALSVSGWVVLSFISNEPVGVILGIAVAALLFGLSFDNFQDADERREYRKAQYE